MKIKTLKIKAEDVEQEYDLAVLLERYCTIYKTEVSLQREKNCLFWYILIMYEPLGYTFFSNTTSTKKTILPEGFEQEVLDYIDKNNRLTRPIIMSALKFNLNYLLEIEKLEDFIKCRNIGLKTIIKDKVFFQGLLNVIQKYNKRE